LGQQAESNYVSAEIAKLHNMKRVKLYRVAWKCKIRKENADYTDDTLSGKVSANAERTAGLFEP